VFGAAGNHVPLTALQIRYVGGATAVPVNPATGVKTTVLPVKTYVPSTVVTVVAVQVGYVSPTPQSLSVEGDSSTVPTAV
jgi:hypothetical protein